MASQGLAREKDRPVERTAPAPRIAKRSGFRLKKRAREAGIDPWWQTITHYMPEPWLIAWRNRHAESRL